MNAKNLLAEQEAATPEREVVTLEEDGDLVFRASREGQETLFIAHSMPISKASLVFKQMLTLCQPPALESVSAIKAGENAQDQSAQDYTQGGRRRVVPIQLREHVVPGADAEGSLEALRNLLTAIHGLDTVHTLDSDQFYEVAYLVDKYEMLGPVVKVHLNLWWKRVERPTTCCVIAGCALVNFKGWPALLTAFSL